MRLPKQPPLSKLETHYLDSLAKECHCKVIREVDPRKPQQRINASAQGWYLIQMDSISCEILAKDDSLKKVSSIIATNLHNKILATDFAYPYQDIVVVFTCITGPNSERRKSFKYLKEDL
jgi:hypothetical protein